VATRHADSAIPRRTTRHHLAVLLVLLGGAALTCSCSLLTVSDEDLVRAQRNAERHRSAGELERTIDILEDVARHRPQDLPVREELVRTCLEVDTIRSRQQAAATLRELVRLVPTDPDYRFELATLLFRQGYDRQATRELEHLLTISPDHAGAHRQLGDIHRERWRQTLDQELVTRFTEEHQRAALLAPADRRACRRAAEDLLIDDRPEEALALLDEAPAADRRQLLDLRGACLADLGRHAEAAAAFELAIARMDAVERAPFQDLGSIVTPYQATRFAELPPDEFVDSLRVFWKRQDPTPTTALNERQVEHYRRVALADAHYAHLRDGGRGAATTKGELLIRYGEPIIDDWELFPALTHYYPMGTAVRRVDFVYLAGTYYLPFTAVPNAAELAVYLAPQSFAWSFGDRWLEHAVSQAGFRGAHGRTRQEVAIAVPAAALAELDDPTLALELVAFDPAWEEVVRIEEPLSATSPAARAGAAGRAFVHRTELELAPGRYLIAAQIASTDGTLIGTQTQETLVRDLQGAGLALSDLSVAFDGALPNATHAFLGEETLHVVFEVYGLTLRDDRARYALSYRIRPAPRFGTSIFGKLLDAMRLRTFVESSLVEESTTSTVSRRLGIDVSQLPADRYDLTIVVADLITGDAPVSRTVRFERLQDR
jgi:GWxTD domain-containing protein